MPERNSPSAAVAGAAAEVTGRIAGGAGGGFSHTDRFGTDILAAIGYSTCTPLVGLPRVLPAPASVVSTGLEILNIC